MVMTAVGVAERFVDEHGPGEHGYQVKPPYDKMAPEELMETVFTYATRELAKSH
jgi:hypothetical protein